jgi:hypothetical protein
MQMMNAGGMSDAKMRVAASDWLAQLIDGIKKRGSRLLVLHQLKGASAGKGPNAKPSTHDAQEDSNLNNLFEFAFATSKLDSDNKMFINCDKARSNARTSGVLQLVGDECRFATLDVSAIDIGNIAVNPAEAAPAADAVQRGYDE